MDDQDRWTELDTAARRAAERAYAPYSGLAVGAAALLDDGRIVTGCNVENASYGLTMCAETGLVARLHAEGFDTPRALAVLTASGRRLLPCGRCRQVLFEASGPELVVSSDRGPITLGDLLPLAFDADALPDRGARR